MATCAIFQTAKSEQLPAEYGVPGALFRCCSCELYTFVPPDTEPHTLLTCDYCGDPHVVD